MENSETGEKLQPKILAVSCDFAQKHLRKTNSRLRIRGREHPPKERRDPAGFTGGLTGTLYIVGELAPFGKEWNL